MMQATLSEYITPAPHERKRGSQTPRPYQVAAVDAVLHAIDPFGEGLNRVLYTAPTGSGKTTTFSEIAARILATHENARILIMAHRVELIKQAYDRVKDHCGLKEWEIGMEIAETKACPSNRVIIGSVQTCMRGTRPHPKWRPTHIICDEAHHAAAKSYRNIATRYGVDSGDCAYIGTTATAKRTDRFSLYAEMPDGSPVMLERKGRAPVPATYETSVFQRLVFDYTVLDAVEDGWLVPLKGHTVQTDTDLNDVETDRDGDFKEAQLQKAVDNAKRTMEAISAWKEIASERPTLVFCAGVEHAHHAADLWRQAGYSAQAVDGETDTFTRSQIFRDFKAGRVRVIANFGIATEGTDLPNCACIVHLRPTKSWTLYLQMSGRGTRVLPGVLEGMEEVEPEVRKSAIAASLKPDTYIIDLVDLYEKCGDLCTAPSILDLPVKLDLQGHSLTEAKKMLDEFDEVKDRVIGECPLTYEDLKVRLEHVSLMTGSGARSKDAWKSAEWGYRYTKVPPQCSCNLYRDGETFRLVVDAFGTRLIDKTGRAGSDIKEYLDAAARRAIDAIDAHRDTMPKVSRGTLGRLTMKQASVLRRNGHSNQDIDTMPYAKAKALIGTYMDAYRARMEMSVHA